VRTRYLETILTCAAIAATSAACAPISSITFGSGGRQATRSERTHRPGPPPHAPAHGYRHTHRRSDGQRLDLVFDSGLGVYVVVGIPGRYYSDGYYLRLDGDQWYASADLDSGWERKGESDLPPGLQKKRQKAKKSGKHQKSHPGKGRW
jgi:hypothetical protein